MYEELGTMTEQELRDYKVPWVKTREELNQIIDVLEAREQTYGTCVYAMSIAATATYNYMAGQLGVTGFQASCADMDILSRTRGMERWMLINFEDALYPQYDLHNRLDEGLAKAKDWLKEKAQKNLDTRDGVESVRKHWEKLANA